MPLIARQAAPSVRPVRQVIQDRGEGRPPDEFEDAAVVDVLANIVVSREFGPLFRQPVAQDIDRRACAVLRRGQLPSARMPLMSRAMSKIALVCFTASGAMSCTGLHRGFRYLWRDRCHRRPSVPPDERRTRFPLARIPQPR